MEEIWRDLPIRGKNSRYQASNLGRLRTVHMVEGIDASVRILKTCVCTRGKRQRVSVCLRNKGKQKNYDVPHLIASCFLENPNNCRVLKHIDGNVENNAVNNLMWVKHQFVGHIPKRTAKIVQKTIDWLYEQINNGRIKCDDTESFINDYKSSMKTDNNSQNQQTNKTINQ